MKLTCTSSLNGACSAGGSPFIHAISSGAIGGVFLSSFSNFLPLNAVKDSFMRLRRSMM